MSLFDRDADLLANRTGRWRWPWAVLGTALTAALAFVLMQAFQLIPDAIPVTKFLFDDSGDDTKLLRPGEPASYAMLVLVFFPLIIAPLVVYRLLHARPWADWPVRGQTRSWASFARASGAFLLVAVIGYTVAYVLFPSRFSRVPLKSDHGLWLALGLAVVLIQSFAEEVAFKGYLFRVWGAVFPYRWPLVVLISVLFTALHWENTDFARDRGMAIIQFMVGSVISFWLFFRTKSLAAPTGLHWANNVFAMLFLTSAPGDFTQAALATYTDPVLVSGGTNLTDVEAWIGLIGGNALFLALILAPQSPFHILAAPSLSTSSAALSEPADQPSAPPSEPSVPPHS